MSTRAIIRIARAFAQIIDAKSPWTYRHSERVAEIAAGIGDVSARSTSTGSGPRTKCRSPRRGV
jgi:HD-GYP domain-containing protein (c-di-GMP phosphodiesterase class II)